MNKYYKSTIAFFMILLFFQCKSAKVINTGKSNFKLNEAQLIKENLKQKPVFKTLKSTLKIAYSEKGKSQTHSLSLRLQKDEKIWMSATFSIVKVLITPKKVSFYNKLDSTYFEGDYTYLSNLLGTELDFQKLQNLLLGEAIYNLNEGSYNMSVNKESYILQPKKQNDLFEIFFLLDPLLFKIKSQQISQPKAFRHLQVDYLSYKEIEKQILPEKIKIIALETDEELIIGLDFKNVVLNEELNFPFKIPSGFKEIKL